MHLYGVAIILAAFFPAFALAANSAAESLDLTQTRVGYFCIAAFVAAYMMVMAEEFTGMRKSKPVIIAAGLMWAAIGFIYMQNGLGALAETAVRHNLMEYGELFLFLLAAMTYINAMNERLAFEALRSWLVRKGFSYRQLFWLTGWLAFFISAWADNLTTALIMCAVVMAVGKDMPKFIALSCINIVVAANAGGVFSPFGDITTLMVWQKGIVDFWGFFALFLPGLVNFAVPAACMHFAVPRGNPSRDESIVHTKRGAKRIIGLFVVTIGLAVGFHSYLHLPPVLGMMTGLGLLQLFGYYLRKTHDREIREASESNANGIIGDVVPFDIFRKVAAAEWDTLLFFYGVILCVGALGFIGYLALASDFLYGSLGATTANIAIGAISAVVDNIPLMFAVLSMQPDMSLGQWLLVTLTAGVGGSLLSIGSAAGVALMGQAHGHYTFFGHLKWTWAIALGYAASIAVHFAVNAETFTRAAGP